MPHICQFLGVNSVTNIELPGGFMPALICIFADWLEKHSLEGLPRWNYPKTQSRQGLRPHIL